MQSDPLLAATAAVEEFNAGVDFGSFRVTILYTIFPSLFENHLKITGEIFDMIANPENLEIPNQPRSAGPRGFEAGIDDLFQELGQSK